MVQVRESAIIEAPIAEVWRILRDFNGHDRWHPAVATSAIEGNEPVDAVGSVRRFRLTDGSELREQLLSLSDVRHALTYCILEAPFPLMGYVASIQLKAVTDGEQTYWEWRSEFHPPPHRRDELVRLVAQDIYRAGFRAIRKILAGSSSAAPTLVGNTILPEPPAYPTLGPFTQAPVAQRQRSDQATTTKSIVVERYGGPEVLSLKNILLPPPGRGEVQIRHTAIGVNFIDVYCRTGYFDLLKLPGVPGMEAAGVIEAVGEGIDGFRIGERVAYACLPLGAYCVRRNLSPELMVRLGDDIPDEIAAATLLKGVSASFLLHDVHPVRSGEVILIHAAAGGVGQLLTQWAVRLGATVIATVSSENKARRVSQQGAHHTVVYTRENFVSAVMRITHGRGVDVIYDAVGKDTFEASLAALAPCGHLISFGQASGDIGPRDIGGLAVKSLTLSRPNYVHFTDSPEKLAPHVARFFSALRQGFIAIQPPKRYDLSDAAEAHRDLETRRTMGSLILTV